MKKISVLFLFFFLLQSTFSQISVNGDYIAIPNPLSQINNIYLFKTIDKSSEIHFKNVAGETVNWYEYKNSTSTITPFSTLSATETYIDPKNNTGYTITVNGKTVAVFWVFDYSQYAPQLNLLTVDETLSDCDNVILKLDGNVPKMEYKTPTGGIYTLARNFTVKYDNVEWKDDKWSKIEEKVDVLPPYSTITVPSPFVNTVFTFSGDQFATTPEFNMPEYSVSSALYTTKSVKGQITSKTTTREGVKNENDRPVKETQLEGSAPLDVQFFSNPTQNVQSYNWVIKRNGQTIITRAVKDHNYTFSEAGNYKVYLTVANGGSPLCTDSSSVDVKVFESQIAVPKIFTPDGDGKNEEFKVAYRSIIEFKASIVNRWGRTVYSWTDPSKGWDGTYNGKPVSDGTYYYVINAKGSDERIYNLKGYLTLLRVK